MGDPAPPSRSQPLDGATNGYGHDASSSSLYKSPDNNTPFYSQLSSLPPNTLRPDHRSPAQASAQYPPHEFGPSMLNMGAMAGALPEYNSSDDAAIKAQGPQSVPRSVSGASTSALVYQLGQNLQMPAQTSGMPIHTLYANGYPAGPYQQPAFGQGSQQASYSNFAPIPARLPGPTSMATYQGYPQPSQYMYYPPPYQAQGQYSAGYPTQGGQSIGVFERRGNLAGGPVGLISPHTMDFQHQDGAFSGARLGRGMLQGEPGAIGSAFGSPFARAQGMSQGEPVSSIPRGPPRKPKQSGHALWVGNLPPQTTVVALKDHFSREATKDIESLFLISKSNCAFVNYRSEASCSAAMHRFHDSRFNGVRLVCRLRRSSAPASGVPTGPSAMVAGQQTNTPPPRTPKLDGEAVDGLTDGISESSDQKTNGEALGPPNSSSKYFIVKSLTLQDLELSVRNGIWATQSHNEDVLNKAFSSTENVYLIFSANKSGEYFGYARMTSPILEDGAQLTASAPKPENIADAPDVPKSIPTPATEWAPRGKVIDDLARGTIFWEAELSESEAEEEPSDKEDRQVDGKQVDGKQVDGKQVDGNNGPVAQSWGKPFKIEWISTNRLPFYRTRGLRNPWNANREVKIARDGTELEPSVGERLVAMFYRVGSYPTQGVQTQLPPHPHLSGLGMPPMRPY